LGWLVIAMGSIAAALGAVYAYSGLDYIQIERGWTAVIAGMGLVSAGIIVIAIGILTLQLGKIVRLLKGATQSLAVEDGFLPDDEQPDDEVQPEAAEAELPIADAPVAVSLPQAQGRSAPAMPDVSKQPPQPVPVEDKTSAAVTPPALSAEDRISLDWLEVAISDLKEPQVSAPLQARAENAAAAPQSVAAKPVVEVPSVAVSYTPPGAGLPRQKPFMPVMPDAAVKPQEPPKPEIAPPDRTKAATVQTALPDPVKSEPLVHEPSVVGRYEAAGTSYAMYSDGSVEAENEHGIFRFGSMAELRAFIEQGQDQSATLPPQGG